MAAARMLADVIASPAMTTALPASVMEKTPSRIANSDWTITPMSAVAQSNLYFMPATPGRTRCAGRQGTQVAPMRPAGDVLDED